MALVNARIHGDGAFPKVVLDTGYARPQIKIHYSTQVDHLSRVIDYRQVAKAAQLCRFLHRQLQAVTYPLIQGLQFINQQAIHRDAQRLDQVLHGKPTRRQQLMLDVQVNHILTGGMTVPGHGYRWMPLQPGLHLPGHLEALLAAADDLHLYRFSGHRQVILGYHHQFMVPGNGFPPFPQCSLHSASGGVSTPIIDGNQLHGNQRPGLAAAFRGTIEIGVVMAHLAGDVHQVPGVHIIPGLPLQPLDQGDGFFKTGTRRQLHLDMHRVYIDVRENAVTNGQRPQAHDRGKGQHEHHQG